MSWDSNILSRPEKHGLELVAIFELTGAGYSFNMVAVWKDAREFYYVGTDSGCSCPVPFENYNGKDDLTGPLTYMQTLDSLTIIRLDAYDPEYNKPGWDAFLDRI